MRGERAGIGVADWASAVLSSGLGRYGRALAVAEQACAYPADVGGPANWSLVELIEAAARAGSPDRATDAMRRPDTTQAGPGRRWRRRLVSRSLA